MPRLKAISMRESNKYQSRDDSYPRTPPKAKPYHDFIQACLDLGLNLRETWEAVTQFKGAELSYNKLQSYAKRHCTYTPRRKQNNWYTLNNTCKEGHEWTSENTLWVHNRDIERSYRRCKICLQKRGKGNETYTTRNSSVDTSARGSPS